MVKYGRWCQVSSRFSLLKTLVFPCKNWSFPLRKLKFGTLQTVVFNCQNFFIIEIRQFFCCAKANRFMNFRHRGGVGKWRFRAIRI